MAAAFLILTSYPNLTKYPFNNFTSSILDPKLKLSALRERLRQLNSSFIYQFLSLRCSSIWQSILCQDYLYDLRPIMAIKHGLTKNKTTSLAVIWPNFYTISLHCVLQRWLRYPGFHRNRQSYQVAYSQRVQQRGKLTTIVKSKEKLLTKIRLKKTKRKDMFVSSCIYYHSFCMLFLCKL